MLTNLRIQNVVLIDQLSIDFHEGFCALTGETGAGKSILLDSLGLALGARSEARLVKKDQEKALVSAVFEVKSDHKAITYLLENDIDCLEETASSADAVSSLILRRSLTKEGRSKAFVNDQPVSARILKELGKLLVEIHGQFETQDLMSASKHREMLDGYAGLYSNGSAQALSGSWSNWQDKQQEYKDLKLASDNAQNEQEYIRKSLEDLDALSPEKGEEEELSALKEKLLHREKVLEGLNSADAFLQEQTNIMGQAWASIHKISDKIGEQGEEVNSALDRASCELQEAINLIHSVQSEFEHSEHNLETLDDRLFALRAQARKHQCFVDDLPEVREKLLKQLTQMETIDDSLETLLKECENAKKQYAEKALDIRKKRQKAASQLNASMKKELAPLKLDKAEFIVCLKELAEEEWGPLGMDHIEFLVSTNPGSEPGPMHKIASGGEMARFMLALKVLLSDVGSAQSLIFDEVDTGIGGSTADAVGERLAHLSQHKQVLVVTHAPQVAARASHHMIVSKEGKAELSTKITKLQSANQRCEEIARMLSGAQISNEARAAAEKLLENVA